MKKAIGYARISTKDQSNWSLPGQVKDITSYCSNKGFELVATFTDDGESSRTFDRAEWNDLHTYVAKHHKEIDYLIVVAYDRFSRDNAEAQMMIRKIEEKFRILIVSTTQDFGLHPESPSYFMMRAYMLVNAEMEWKVIRDRTKTGMHRGAKEGRYLRKAPTGYLNSRDDRGKPIIVVDPEKAPYIREIYRLYLQGVSFIEIYRLMSERGFKLQGNSRVQRILANPTYAGLIHVPAYYDEPEQVVKALHDGLIDEPTWWRVQALMKKPLRQYAIVNEEVPLRNVLKCSCGKPLTAAPSKGKYKSYWYYWCTEHRKDNYSANKIHAQFEELTQELSLSDRQIEYLERKIAYNVQTELQDYSKEIEGYKREQKELEIKIDTLEQKYIFESLPKETYLKYKLPLQNQLYSVQDRINTILSSLNGGWKRYSEQLYKLRDIQSLFRMADINMKQAFIRLVFEGKLYYQNGAFRTLFLMPLFRLKTHALQEKGLLYVEQPSPVFTSENSFVPLERDNTNFSRLMEWVESVETAA